MGEIIQALNEAYSGGIISQRQAFIVVTELLPQICQRVRGNGIEAENAVLIIDNRITIIKNGKFKDLVDYCEEN